MSLYCCDFAEGYAEFVSVCDRTARKHHLCDECQGGIAPGQTYRYEAAKFEGDFYTRKMCERCDNLSASLGELGYCYEQGDLLGAYAEFLRQEKRSFPQWLRDMGYRP